MGVTAMIVDFGTTGRKNNTFPFTGSTTSFALTASHFESPWQHVNVSIKMLNMLLGYFMVHSLLFINDLEHDPVTTCHTIK